MHPGFPTTVLHHMFMHCSTTKPITKLATCSTALIQDVSFQKRLVFEENTAIFDSYFRYFDCENHLQNAHYMKTCALITTKPKESPNISQHLLLHVELFSQCANTTVQNWFASLKFQNSH